MNLSVFGMFQSGIVMVRGTIYPLLATSVWLLSPFDSLGSWDARGYWVGHCF